MFRRLILFAADSPLAREVVQRHGTLFGVRRFVAGESLDDCVAVIRRLNTRGLKANTTILGEGVLLEEEADSVTLGYETILRRFAAERLRANIALKLSHLGIGIDESHAQARLSQLLDLAGRLDAFIRIDMEQSALVDATLRTYRAMRERRHDNVGLALQAYLYRSAGDLEALLLLQPNVRIVKGAYLEPPTIAYPRKADVDANYIRLAERALTSGAYTAIATHDERIIGHLRRFTSETGLPNQGRFEFQMLYGVRPGLQLDLAARGYPVLVATPYGPEWYPYLMRRLAERPANVMFLARNLMQR